METRKTILGAEHPDTLTSMHNFAYIRKSQSRNEEAISLMTESSSWPRASKHKDPA